MAKVSLRVYNREIEKMVDSGELDEAIAHSRHILNTFPKNLDTYRLLGKAYLESKLYKATTDIFERLLMSVPDDFVAHVGLSIIHDEQKNYDAAIWHMERAFEVQPSNAAIQSELQRLYGRRDGVEPPKIRLTRGALAHMYIQGELYPQAISEIKNVLDEDPERQDMQVLLARAYFYAGQKGEGVEICSQLLRRYPYCFDANRVLYELHPNGDQSQGSKVYQDRIVELDPYSKFVRGSIFQSEKVDEKLINMERLEWDGKPVDLGAEWSESRGIGREGTDADSDSAQSFETAPGGMPIPTTEGSTDETIPGFMKDAGWGEDTGAFHEGQSTIEDSDESPEGEPIAEGDLPDWVKSMAPAGAGAGEQPDQADLSDDITLDDIPDWLQGQGDAHSTMPAEDNKAPVPIPDSSPQATPGEQAASTEEVPDWLQSETREGAAAQEESTLGDSKAASDPKSSDLGTIDNPVGEVDLGLKDLEQGSTTEEPLSPMPEDSTQPTSNELEAPTPDAPSQSEAPVASTDAPELEDKPITPEDQDNGVGWLEGLAIKHGAKSEELVTAPEDRQAEAPDWAKGDSEVGQDSPAANNPDQPDNQIETLSEPAIKPEDTPAQSDDTGAKPDPISQADTNGSSDDQDDTASWLEGLASKEASELDEILNFQTNTLQDDSAAPVEESTQPVDNLETVAETPEHKEDSAPETTEAPDSQNETSNLEHKPVTAEQQDEGVAWLEGLASKQGAKPEELVTDPKSRKETAPDWIQDASEPIADKTAPEEPSLEQPKAEPSADQEEQDETGMWLREMGEAGGFDEEKREASDATETIASSDANTRELETKPALEVNSRELEPEPALETIPIIQETDPESPENPDVATPDKLKDGDPDAVSETDETLVQGSTDEELPGWLEGLDDAPKQKEGPSDEGMPEWLNKEVEGEESQPEPTSPNDWRPLEGTQSAHGDDVTMSDSELEEEDGVPAHDSLPPSLLEQISLAALDAERVPDKSLSGQAQQEQDPQSSPEPHDPDFEAAQNELNAGNISKAIEMYTEMIKNGQLLEEIILTLREALNQYPVEISILQTLGDAYMRDNRLQDALDSYTKAEELLR